MFVIKIRLKEIRVRKDSLYLKNIVITVVFFKIVHLMIHNSILDFFILKRDHICCIGYSLINLLKKFVQSAEWTGDMKTPI